MKKLIIAVMAFVAVPSFANSTDIAVSLLKSLEGYKATTYKCTAGKSTIGYGFTDKESVSKGYISREDAERKLKCICISIRQKLRKEIGNVRMTEKQEAALISFVYNVGWYNFKTSTMCKMLKANYSAYRIGKEFSRWVYVTKGNKKVESKGLKNRRMKESRLFTRG